MTSNPLHAPHYPDQAWHQTVAVIANLKVARDTYRLQIECPQIAQWILPGQFVMLRLMG